MIHNSFLIRLIRVLRGFHFPLEVYGFVGNNGVIKFDFCGLFQAGSTFDVECSPPPKLTAGTITIQQHEIGTGTITVAGGQQYQGAGAHQKFIFKGGKACCCKEGIYYWDQSVIFDSDPRRQHNASISILRRRTAWNYTGLLLANPKPNQHHATQSDHTLAASVRTFSRHLLQRVVDNARFLCKFHTASTSSGINS